MPLSARRSAERAIQRLRQAEIIEWYRGLRKAIAEAERAWRRLYRPGDGDDRPEALAGRNNRSTGRARAEHAAPVKGGVHECEVDRCSDIWADAGGGVV